MNLLKKIIPFCFLLIFCGGSIMQAQCPDGDVILETQAEVDSFAVLYPDCTEIEGDLQIGILWNIGSDITDISPLSQIVLIGGSLRVWNNLLLDLVGLENLISIGENIDIVNNKMLLDLSQLVNLTSLEGDMKIESSDSLASLTGLENITTIGGLLSIRENDNLSNLNELSGLISTGDLSIYGNENLISLSGLENVTTVGGHLEVGFNPILLNLEGLIGVTSVEGIDISSNYTLIDLSGLENVTTVEGRIGISGNINLVSLSGLENVTSIGSSLGIGANDSLASISVLGNLTSIGSSIGIYANDNLMDLSGLENVTSIGEGGIVISSNEGLVSLAGLDNMASIGGSLQIINNTNLSDLSHLGSLNFIQKEIRILDNQNLVSLNGLESVDSIRWNLIIGDNPALSDITGLESVVSVGMNLNISDNDNLVSLEGLENLTVVGYYCTIEDNAVLSSLSGLGGLTTLGRYLRIENNDALINLNGLEGLTSGNDLEIEIRNNDNLYSLIGLQNIDYNTIARLVVGSNPMLSICSASSVCSYLKNGGDSAISGNASGCNSSSQVRNACLVLPGVKNNVFYDINQNKIKDLNEPNNYDTSVRIESGNTYYTQNDGIFYIQPGSYTAIFDEANNPNWQLTTDSVSYFLSLEESETDTITFGIYPTQQISDIQTTINTPPARCNEVIILDAKAKNLGTTIASGIVWLTLDDAGTDYIFMEQPDTTIANTNTSGWYFSDLFPSQSIERQVSIQIPGPPDFTLGDSLVFDIFVDFEDENGSQSSQTFIYETEVRCSYDPNDKLVHPDREDDYVLFEEDLIYTIRFQNTGNDVAYDVVIRDTLDANLDFSTFRLLGSSHANVLNTILNEDQGILTFEFRDIFLPDSTTNFEASQGYVNYLIHTIDGLAEETLVTNSAGIYFDFNPPVITNTTQSIMVSELPTVSIEMPDNLFNFNILPNPNTGIFTLQGIPKGTYQIHNTSGQIIRQGNIQNDQLIDISLEVQGVYFISVTVDNTTSVRRMVKM